MPLSLREQVDTLETRTGSLESVLGQFIISMNGVIIRMERSTAAFREEVRADTQAFKDEVRADTQAFKDEVRADTKNLKDEMKAFREEVRADTQAFRDEIRADTKNLKHEMRDFKDEMRDFKDEMKADTRHLKREVGKLTRKMGTLVEDMVAPNMRSVAGEYFGGGDFDFFAVRLWKKNAEDPGLRREFDVIAVSAEHFFINETKSKPRPEDVGEFADLLEDIGSWFPQSAGKRVVPIFSSLYVPENVRKYLTRKKIYAMGLREGTMDLLNFKEISP